MRTSLRFRLVALVAASAIGVGCGSSTPSVGGSGSSLDPTTFSASMGSTDLYVGAPQRVAIGVFQSTQTGGVQLLTSGTVDLRLSPYQGGSGTPVQGQAHYVGAPGTEKDTGTPHLSDPGTARGVYELANVTFDQGGVWEAGVLFQLDGTPLTLSTQFTVTDQPRLPAPGQKALRTQNLTMASKANPQAIDSRAQDGAPVPDPELHQDTIAGAIAQHRATLALFATPVYCESQFCGPSVDALQQIAKVGPKNADYIHVEIWNDYGKNQVNKAAADWLLRNGDLTEPWLFLIGRDGTIVDRWGPLFDPAQVLTELRHAAG